MHFESNFKYNDEHREILPLDTEGLQFICNHAEMKYPLLPEFPFHWHNALEFNYVQEGEVEIQTTEEIHRINKGEAFFVNSNVIHSIKTVSPGHYCNLYAFLFAPEYLSGLYNHEIDQKYMRPILKAKNFDLFVIKPDHLEALKIIENIIHIINLTKEEPFGYEFTIRYLLSEVWCAMLKETSEIRTELPKANEFDLSRIKLMIGFIQSHYMEKISLNDISMAANISVRECNRCFSRCLSQSPNNYLMKYRLSKACKMLIYSSDSITTISENCGFNSSSYMGKLFSDTFNCTPKEYRKKYQSTAD